MGGPGHLMSTVHVVPVNDLIEHDASGSECVCGPTTEPVDRGDGSFGWVITHHSLDGREAHEKEGTPVNENPKSGASETKADARSRALRSLGQAAAVTALVGAATAVYELTLGGEALTLATVATAAGTGALMAVAAWVQRRLEGRLEGRGGAHL